MLKIKSPVRLSPPRLSRVKGGNSSTCFYVSREPVPETTHTIKETHPVPVLRFCFNLTTFLSLWYRKFTFWYYSQNIVNIFYPTQNWHQIGCLPSVETPGCHLLKVWKEPTRSAMSFLWRAITPS